MLSISEGRSTESPLQGIAQPSPRCKRRLQTPWAAPSNLSVYNVSRMYRSPRYVYQRVGIRVVGARRIELWFGAVADAGCKVVRKTTEIDEFHLAVGSRSRRHVDIRAPYVKNRVPKGNAIEIDHRGVKITPAELRNCYRWFGRNRSIELGPSQPLRSDKPEPCQFQVMPTLIASAGIGSEMSFSSMLTLTIRRS